MSDHGPNLRAAKAEILLRHAQERIASLTAKADILLRHDQERIAELEAAVKTQQQYLDNKDSVIKGMNEMVKRLEGDLEVMRLQRDATQSSRCPNCERLRAALKQIALYRGHEPAKDFTHCVQIARYALYPEGVEFRSKEFYELAELALREDEG